MHCDFVYFKVNKDSNWMNDNVEGYDYCLHTFESHLPKYPISQRILFHICFLCYLMKYILSSWVTSLAPLPPYHRVYCSQCGISLDHSPSSVQYTVLLPTGVYPCLHMTAILSPTEYMNLTGVISPPSVVPGYLQALLQNGVLCDHTPPSVHLSTGSPISTYPSSHTPCTVDPTLTSPEVTMDPCTGGLGGVQVIASHSGTSPDQVPSLVHQILLDLLGRW